MIEDRIERLERSNRRLRQLVIAALGGSCVAGFMAAQTPEVADKITAKTIAAESIVIMGRGGQPVAEWNSDGVIKSRGITVAWREERDGAEVPIAGLVLDSKFKTPYLYFSGPKDGGWIIIRTNRQGAGIDIGNANSSLFIEPDKIRKIQDSKAQATWP